MTNGLTDMNDPTPAEKAMQDITALLEQHYSGEATMTEVDVVMAVNRIVGRYDIERLGHA